MDECAVLKHSALSFATHYFSHYVQRLLPQSRYADYGTSESYLVPTAKEQLRQSWLASKPSHQFWWCALLRWAIRTASLSLPLIRESFAHTKDLYGRRYWCIGPTDPRSMNTFIERPAIEARLLYWLTALHAVNGMLYYDVSTLPLIVLALSMRGHSRPAKRDLSLPLSLSL